MIITLFKLLNMDHQINLLKMIGKLNGLSFYIPNMGTSFEKKEGQVRLRLKQTQHLLEPEKTIKSLVK